MEAVVESLPLTNHISIAINVQAEMKFSAYAARRKVNRYVADEISYLLRGAEPKLVVAEHLCWRVPVILTFPATGVVGAVGEIDVDVETGQLYITPELIKELTHHAHARATAYSPAIESA